MSFISRWDFRRYAEAAEAHRATNPIGWDAWERETILDALDWNRARKRLSTVRVMEFNLLVNWTFWPSPKTQRRSHGA